MTDDRRYIPKKSPVHLCKTCGRPTYRIWVFSREHDRQEPIVLDCEGEGLARPKSLIGGVGKIHVCKAKESVA